MNTSISYATVRDVRKAGYTESGRYLYSAVTSPAALIPIHYLYIWLAAIAAANCIICFRIPPAADMFIVSI